MQKMMIIDGEEEIEGYEFLEFGLACENIAGEFHIYTVAICKDRKGFIEQYPIYKVKFI